MTPMQQLAADGDREDDNAILSIIIVAYNNHEDLSACLESVAPNHNNRVIVVDNSNEASEISSIERICSGKEFTQLIQTDENLGFAKAVNVGIRARATEEDIVLLNPDTRLDDGCIAKLRAASLKYRDTAILSPVVYSEASVRTMSAGEQPTIPRLFLHYSGISRLFWRWPILRGRYLFLDRHATVDRCVGWTAGCVWFLRSEAVKDVGLLSERWFLYGEDTEYCRRVVKAGWRIRVIADARAYHSMGAAVQKEGGPISTMWPVNTFDYYCEEFSPGVFRRTLWRIVFSSGLASRAAILSLRPETRPRASRLAKLAKAIW